MSAPVRPPRSGQGLSAHEIALAEPDDPLDLRRLRRAYARIGPGGLTLALTLLTTSISVSATLVMHALFELPPGRGHLIGVLIALGLPLLVTPPIAHVILRLIDHLFALEGRLRHQATHDVLTGLNNRRWILQRLAQAIEANAGRPNSVGVLIVDVDHFKVINDRLGHQAGDVVLRAVAQRLRRVLRRHDAIGRYGGEEFLIVAHDLDDAALARLADRVLAAVGDTPIPYLQARLPVTVSVGGARVAPRAGVDALADALHAADRALYAAKAGGRNRRVFDAGH